MQPKIFFVTGVVGAGKTSLVEPLRAQLGHWLSVGVANRRAGTGTVICGFALPGDEDDRDLVKFILLDLNESALRGRLMQRYSDPAQVKDLERMRGAQTVVQVRDWIRRESGANS